MMLTSAGHRGDAEHCQKLGVSAYLLKPMRQSELREAIAKVLGAREQEGWPASEPGNTCTHRPQKNDAQQLDVLNGEHLYVRPD